MMRTVFGWTIALVASLVLISAATAADQNQTFNDPKGAGPDFKVQGEYLTIGDSDDQWGVQVIALGDGKFDAVAFPGGLPGERADMNKPLKGTGETKDGVTTITFGEDAAVATIENGIMTFRGDKDDKDSKLKRVVRVSSTMGAKAPEGAVVLFDSTSADAFDGGRMTDDGLLMEGCTSKEKFQDFAMHIEFRTPFKPFARGQGRGNSGFYAHGRYEVQMLDSFGLEGKDNECGGVYSIAAPKLNMCYPPLSWQTYDIDFKAAKFDDTGKKIKDGEFTVKHNGVLIHENQILDHATTASPMREGPEPGPVFLQNHGNPVRYRNIWVVPK